MIVSEDPHDNGQAAQPDGALDQGGGTDGAAAAAEITEARLVPWERTEGTGAWAAIFHTLGWVARRAVAGGPGDLLEGTRSLPEARRLRRRAVALALLVVAVCSLATVISNLPLIAKAWDDAILHGWYTSRLNRMWKAKVLGPVLGASAVAVCVFVGYLVAAGAAVGWFFCSRTFDDEHQDRALAPACYLQGVFHVLWAAAACIAALLSGDGPRALLNAAGLSAAVLLLSVVLVAAAAQRVFGSWRRTVLTAVGLPAAWAAIALVFVAVPAAIVMWVLIPLSLS